MSRYQKSKAISVKIATVKVIKALEDKLAQFNKDYSAQEALEKKYEKEIEKLNYSYTEQKEKFEKEIEQFKCLYEKEIKQLKIKMPLF